MVWACLHVCPATCMQNCSACFAIVCRSFGLNVPCIVMDLTQRLGIDWKDLASDVSQCRVDRIAELTHDMLESKKSNYRVLQRCLKDFLFSQVRRSQSIGYTCVLELPHNLQTVLLLALPKQVALACSHQVSARKAHGHACLKARTHVSAELKAQTQDACRTHVC